MQDLDEAVRRYLAWESIVTEKESLNLDPQQVRQATAQKESADSSVSAQIPEAYQWLLVPTQSSPQAKTEWQAIRLSGQDSLAVRASRRLKNDELLITSFASSRLRMELDRVPLWRGDHVAVNQIIDDFARYLYLPRLRDSDVLRTAIRGGIALLTWKDDGFAYADSYDEVEGRYRALRYAQQLEIGSGETGLLVKSDVAAAQTEPKVEPAGSEGDDGEGTTGTGAP
jgi:hypothetical protein